MNSGGMRIERRAGRYRFGEFELVPNQGALWRAGVRVPLMPKPFATLLVLVERAGETVSKDELLREVWPDTAVEENNLTQSVSTLRKVLGEKRGENRYIATEPGFGYRFVATVTNIEEAPVLATEVELPPAVPVQKHRSLSVWLTLSIAVLVVAAASFYVFLHRPAALPVRASIAVLGFRDLSTEKDSSWISAAVSELMNVDLGAEQRLRILPLDNVSRMRTELALTLRPAYPVELLQRIRRNLGSDYLVTGAYLPNGPAIHLDVTLFDLRSARALGTIGDDATYDQLPQLTERCTQRIRTQLGVRLSATSNPPFEAAAMEPYARGMELLRQGDALSARPYLQKAAQTAPSNPLVHAGLAAAWSALGLDVRSAQEAKLAFDYSGALGRVEQLEIEGRYRAITQDWPRAVQVYTALFTLLPDDLEYGLQLASAESYGGKAQEALTTVKALRALPPPITDDPRIDLAEARAAGALSDFARTRQAAERAAERARARGATLQYARARLLQAGAMQTMAVAGFSDVRSEARGICAQLGDHACVAAAYRTEANQMSVTGNLPAARRLYQSALEISNQIGNSLEKLNGLNGLAYDARLEGDLPSAENYLQAALVVGTEMGPQKRYPICLDLAQVLAEEGHIARARMLIAEALQVSQQIGDQEGVGLSHAVQGELFDLEGKSSEALDSYKDALRILRQVNEPVAVGETLLEYGNIQLRRGDLVGARKSFEESRALPTGLPTGSVAPESELAFAHLSFAEGHFADAASQARLALKGMTAAGRKGDQLEATAVLTRALIALGKATEASEALVRANPQEVAKLPIESLFHYRIARCYLLANTGHNADALQAIDLLNADARRLGVPVLEKESLQAKQALLKIRLSAGV
jgi:DNA-binding winged helix-turn-helix (wHTH) protein/tetratricopeptide (TPR) repeat protein